MKISVLMFVVVMSSANLVYAQDTTSHEVPFGIRTYFGIDNNKWESINQFLRSNNLDGNFNTVSFFYYGIGFCLGADKIEFEVNNHFSSQSFNASGKDYTGTSFVYNMLFHYKFYKKKEQSFTVFSGINMQELAILIDTMNTNSFSLTNFSRSDIKKEFYYLPIGIDYHYRTHGLELGAKFQCNILLYQSDWTRINNSTGKTKLNNPAYFELGVYLGFSTIK